MKNKISLFIFTLCSVLIFTGSVRAAGATDYASLNKAFQEAADNEVITLDQDITISEQTGDNYIKAASSSAKNITLDLQGHTISSVNKDKGTIIVENNLNLTITGNGTVKHTNNQPALIIKNGDVTIENGTFAVETTPYYAIHVGDNDKADKASEDLTNTLTIKNATVTNSKSGGIIVMTKHSKVDIENIDLNVVDNTAISTYSSTQDVEINIKDGNLIATRENKENNVDAIGILGKEIRLNISGGYIEALEGIGINSNNSGNTSTINISGGTIKAHVGMYQPQNAETTITAGTIEGAIGIVARQGSLNISGGTIIGNAEAGEEEFAVGYGDNKLTPGAAVIVDNGPKTYGDDLVTNITGGVFEATSENAVVSYEDNTTDFTITGGQYNKPFNQEFVQNNEAEVQMGDNYYVGASAEKAVQNAPAGSTVTVLQGDLELSNIGEGVTVENKGDGQVSVNGKELDKDSSYTTPITSHNNKDENKEEERLIVEGVTYTDKDNMQIEGSIVTEANETYNKMIEFLKAKGYQNIFKMYEIHVKDNQKLSHSLTITFDLGTINNGKIAYILHQKHDGSYEEFTKLVENGKVSIEVSELSPFIIAFKEEENKLTNIDVTATEQNQDVSNNAQTSSIDVVKYAILSALTFICLVALIISMKKEES